MTSPLPDHPPRMPVPPDPAREISAAATAAVADGADAPFRLRERVRWEDVDLVGIVRYSAFPRFHDAVEAEMLRAAGHPIPTIVETLGVWLPRRVLHVEYFAPVRFDVEVEARLWVAAIGGSSITLAGELWSDDGAVRHAAWHVVLVCVEAGSLAKRAVPDALARALARFRGPAVAAR